MITLRKALTSDFDSVYTVLLKFGSNLPKEKWKLLFENHWQNPEGFIGYLLEEEQKAIGFLGLIFSERIINNKKEKFCNLSSWIIDPEYRKNETSLLPLLKALEMEDYTFTTFTATEKAVKIYNKLKFKVIDNRIRIVFRGRNRSKDEEKKVLFDDEITAYLNDADLKIYQDHKKFNCHHVLMLSDKEYCYLVLKNYNYSLNKLEWPKYVFYFNYFIGKLFRYSFLSKSIVCGKIHYLSNPELFSKQIPNYKNFICNKLRVKGLIVDDRFVKNSKIKNSMSGSWCKTLYKSDSLAPDQIDSLYTELFILDY